MYLICWVWGDGKVEADRGVAGEVGDFEAAGVVAAEDDVGGPFARVGEEASRLALSIHKSV